MAQDFFRNPTASGNLRKQTIKGGVATVVSQAVTTIAALGAIAALARLLEADDFGMIAMVTVFTNFAAMFVDAGLSLPTIQRSNITRAQVTNLFWLSVVVSVLVAGAVALCSPLVAWFFDEPRLVSVTIATSVSDRKSVV